MIPLPYRWDGQAMVDPSALSPIEDEVWISIPPIPQYASSSHGRIKRIAPVIGGGGSKRRSGTILSQRALPTGHRQVTVSVCNKVTTYLVHRLVAFAFIGPQPDGLPFVCHRDDTPWHNWPANLYWGNRRDNALDAIENGKTAKGELVSSAKITADNVRCIRSMFLEGRDQRDIAALFGISQSNVSMIVGRKTWRHVL